MKISKLIYKKLKNNKRGNVLPIVVVFGAFLFIITTALMTRVGVATKVNNSINSGENSYLAARSGVVMLTDKINTDPVFANNAFNSCFATEAEADANPIKMDFGDIGVCDVSLHTLRETTTAVEGGNETVREVRAKCVGSYDNGSQFTINRKLTIKKTTQAADTGAKVKPSALQMYDDSSLSIAGGIDGDVKILGNGTLKVYNAQIKPDKYTPMHNITCKNGFVQIENDSACFFESVTVGKYFSSSQVNVLKDISCGMEGENDSFINLAGRNSVIGGVLRCSGDVNIANKARIAYNNIEKYDGTSFADTPIDKTEILNKLNENTEIVLRTTQNNAAIISEGNVYLGRPVAISSSELPVYGADGKHVVNNSDTDEVICIYGDIYCEGDIYLGKKAIVYGDVYCKGNARFVDPSSYCNAAIKGTLYCSDIDPVSASHAGNFTRICVKDPDATRAAIGDANATGLVMDGGAEYAAKVEGLTIDSEAKKNFKRETDGVLAAPKTIFGDLADGLDVFDASTRVSELNGSDYISKTVVPATATGTNYTALYAKVGLNQWNYDCLLYITKSCVIKGNYEGTVYIDTSKFNQDIDVFLDGTITTVEGGWKRGLVAVNDNGGQNKVRLFLKSGAKVDMGTGRGFVGTGVQTVGSGDSAVTLSATTYGHDLAVETSQAYPSPVRLNASSGGIDDGISQLSNGPLKVSYDRVPRFYIFAEEEQEFLSKNPSGTYVSPEIKLGGAAQITGNVLTISSTYETAANDHGCSEGVPYTDGAYPTVFGMLMCKYADFKDHSSSYVRFDPKLKDPATLGLTGDDLVKAEEAYEKAYDQFQDDISGVIVFPGGSGSPVTPPANPPLASTKWVAVLDEGV